MRGLRHVANSGVGKACLGGVAILALAWAVYSVRSVIGSSDLAGLSRRGTFMDAATGKPFSYTISPGDKIPVKAPSGGHTGYPAEMCYWNVDGTLRSEPFPVLLNTYASKPGPTFCPDCGRLVLARRSAPAPGQPPPPTRAEYLASRGNAEDTE